MKIKNILKIRHHALTLLPLVVLCMSGCNTVPIPGPLSVTYPEGISRSEALKVVAVGIQGGRTLPTSNPELVSTTKVDAAVFGNFAFGEANTYAIGKDAWVVTSVSDGRLGCTFVFKNQHTLYADVVFLEDCCEVEISGSDNLKQEDGMIHHEAPVWQQDLARVVKVSLSDFAIYKLATGENGSKGGNH